MRVWHIAKARYPSLDGEGARLAGGRWNTEGKAVVYTSGNLSLAVLELLVHTDADIIPDDLIALEIEIPADVRIEELHTPPSGWRTTQELCRQVGDEWIESGRGLVLMVPSAIVPMEHNYLLNPAHADMQRVSIIARHPFEFDPRLFG